MFSLGIYYCYKKDKLITFLLVLIVIFSICMAWATNAAINNYLTFGVGISGQTRPLTKDWPPADIFDFTSTYMCVPKIEPKKDGLIIECGEYSGLFLPQVWKELPDKEEFLEQADLTHDNIHRIIYFMRQRVRKGIHFLNAGFPVPIFYLLPELRN